MASITEQGDSIKLDPTPGFVVKSKIVSAENTLVYALSTKVFINVCHDSQVPRPAQDFDPAIIFPLIMDNQWEIPLIVSREKHTKDKKGQPSFVYDCCINTTCFQWCQINSDLRSILVEWCIESIELLFDVVLEREYTIPKMLSKGELSQTIILKDELDESGFQKKLQNLKKNETLGLIEELNGEKEDRIDEKEGELPSLMNIKQKRDANTNPKPLIQEINDMKIDECKPIRKVVPAADQTAKLQSIPKTYSHAQLESNPIKLNYTIMFRKLNHPYELLVKFECKDLQSSREMALFYNGNTHAMSLNSSNPRYYFNLTGDVKDRTLEIPLPKELTVSDDHSFSSFYVKHEHSLYIYC